MFIIRFIRRLFALPLTIVAGVLSIFVPQLAVGFYKLAWLVSGDGHPGSCAISMLLKTGQAGVALAEADRMMRRRPSADVASLAGLMEVDCGNIERAGECLAVARSTGGDRDGLTELLAYYVEVKNASDSEQAGVLLESLAQRRDLSPTVSKLALEGMMWRTLTRGDLEAARRRALHLLEVSENPQASIVMAALHEVEGQSAEAARCSAAAAGLPTAQKAYYRCVAAKATDNEEQLRSLLADLRAEDSEAAGKVELQLASGEGEL